MPERAGLRFSRGRTFARGGAVIVAQRAMWTTAGEISEREVASSFVVRDGRVARYARFDDLGEALRDAGLSEGDEVL